MVDTLLFLQLLLAYQRRVADLLGDDWPSFRERLLALLSHLRMTSPRDEVLAIVDDLFAAGLDTPAAELFRELMRNALAEAGEPARRRQSLEVVDPTAGTTRTVEIAAPYAQSAEAVRRDVLDAAAELQARLQFPHGLPPLLSPPASSEASIDAPAAEESAREIVVTGHDEQGNLVSDFHAEHFYRLQVRVAAPTAGNLTHGETKITDVPPHGLDTTCVVSSMTVEIAAVSAGSIRKRGSTWVAEFDLHIPAEGDSGTVTLDVRTTTVSGELMLDLLIAGEKYRSCTVTLGHGATTTVDIIANLPTHLNLVTTHEWTTPPEHIQVRIVGQLATISTLSGPNDYGDADWLANDTLLKNPIQRVRDALDKVRRHHERYFNDLEDTDLASRLDGPSWWMNIWPGVGWSQLTNFADEKHRTAANEVLQSSELRALASEGYRLFDTCFPEGHPLRDILQQLLPGSRIDFSWLARGAVGWVSHVPWALMYMDPPTVAGAIDCQWFLGLRFRVGNDSWEPKAPSRALGDPAALHALHFLYWGRAPQDAVGVEAEWQKRVFARWQRHHFLPDPASADPKLEVQLALEKPTPDPAAILYFYCHCAVKDGSDPVLQFDGDGTVANTLNASEISQGRLPSAPLVFANACTTAASDPQGTSELESTFFRRHVRAFVGTETKVPVTLASRFAWLFFQFFLRHADPEGTPMAAGEALAQARLFLWTQYQNLGGLFYCLVNKYDLYFASDAEVRQRSRLNR